MLVMRSGSSRFFVVLLHLVGVSTHLPSSRWYWTETGIVGVNPFTIVLEQLDLSQLEAINNEDDNNNLNWLLHHPHWLQDVTDGKCLGPMGSFSDCGDATLWFVLPKQKRIDEQRKRQWIRWALESSEKQEHDPPTVHGYALQLMNDNFLQIPSFTQILQNTTTTTTTTTSPATIMNDTTTATANDDNNTASTSSTRHNNIINKDSPIRNYQDKECLSVTRRSQSPKLALTSCASNRAWSWHINEQGILYFEPQKSRSSRKQQQQQRNRKRLLRDDHALSRCLWRPMQQEQPNLSSDIVILSSCSGQPNQTINSTTAMTTSNNEQHQIFSVEQRVVQFAVVRQAIATPGTATTNNNKKNEGTVRKTETSAESPSLLIQQQLNDTIDAQKDPRSDRLPPSKADIAHSHASSESTNKVQTELKSGGRVTFNPSKTSPSSTPSPIQGQQHPLQFFKNTNPILLAGGAQQEQSSQNQEQKRTKGTTPHHHESPLHKTPAATASTLKMDATGAKPAVRRIFVHPYIQAAENEIWTDPQTGLEYRTDLCQYLGHDRKESGRHTLTGVGQYMRTVFNIKVYGVAFYVSKRDVLADPLMEPFADISALELREREDFYLHLRNMPSPKDPTAGIFDRTLLLKINMQLSTETMRSSLEADWKMLTPESKKLLIDSSLKPRPATDTMIDIVTSPDNPSKCSCAQIAPEEYKADPSCCARGTELVFTWRKNGDLEVRLNGDLMDTFPRPDIAAGIFFEYLRLDDPMSLDFLDRVVDGFPFLLAPLSQVKGVSSPMRVHHHSSSSSSTKHGSGNPVFKMIGGMNEALSSHASELADFVQSGASKVTTTALSTVRSVGDVARSVGEDIDRRRDILGKHVSNVAHHALNSVMTTMTVNSRDTTNALSVIPKWAREFHINDDNDTRHSNLLNQRGRHFLLRNAISNLLLGDINDGTTTISAPDEIAPMIHPSTHSTQRLFIGMVHLYLLLLLIVSFPASLTTRTKLVVIRKSSHQHELLSDDDSDSESSSASCDDYTSSDKGLLPMHEEDVDDGTNMDILPERKMTTLSSLKRPNRLQMFCSTTIGRTDATFGDDDHHHHRHHMGSTNTKDGNIKKSLSYVL